VLIPILNETPAGTVGGGNVIFTLARTAGTIGNYADVYCDGERYHVFDYNGVLTKAA